jgi:pimeloyl-ACP methyl ester carboxylesterase
VVLIIPGSGPTDRDGNNPLGVTAAPYRLLADGLASRGISSVRIDKRGLFGSKAAIADPNKVTIAHYAADAHAWAASARAATGAGCVWLLGHSEGGLIALAAGQKPEGFCGVIIVAGPGRKLGVVMREQLRANPANAPILPAALAALDSLEAGKPVDAASLPAPLQPLFNAAVQPFVMNLLAQDPAGLAASLTVPLLVVQGDRDIQVTVDDARVLAAAQAKARLAVLPGVNHVLKAVTGDDRGANLATYADPSLPIAPSVIDTIAGFVKP